MSLRSIVLWPKKHGAKVKQIQFKNGAINVITGQSRTGKSSLIHIVDYCLGSGKCSIPVGVIRQAVEWYGVLLQLPGFQLMVGRLNPGQQIQSGDVFLIEGESLDPATHIPVKNGNVEFLKQRLNELAGLPNLRLDPDSSSGFKGPPSFRDLAAFIFQPQHIVANPHTLFFKTDTFEHREKLCEMFPLVLGAMTAQQLVAKHQIHQLQGELDKKQIVLDRQQEAATAWTSQIRAFATRAKELGLIARSVQISSNDSVDTLLELLRGVPRRLAEGKYPRVDVGAANELVSRIRELEEQEDTLARDLSAFTRRKLQIERLRTSVTAYSQQLATAGAKLNGIGWLSDRLRSTDTCPFCEQSSDAGQVALNELIDLSERMKQLSTSTHVANPALEKESNRLDKETRNLESTLALVREEHWSLEDKSAELAERRRTITEAFRLSGRIEQALELYARIDADSEIMNAVATLKQQIEELQKIVNPSIERMRLSGALQRFTQTASRYIEPLELERATDPLELDIKELMVLVLQGNDRKDALWEIGSAENWLGYHIATLLALHEEFLRIPNCPVPSFLMVDQPSQAYFPDSWPEDEGEQPELLLANSKDIAGVKRIFEALALAIKRSGGKLQVIVTDHAGAITWEGVDSINFIGNWREGKDEFLIPANWIEQSETNP